MLGDQVKYVLVSSQTTQNTMSFLKERLSCVEGLKFEKTDESRIIVRYKYGHAKTKVYFTVSKQNVVAVFYTSSFAKVVDLWWDRFLEQFLILPTIFHNIEISNGKPRIIDAMFASSEYKNTTKFKTVYSPKVIGWESETTVVNKKERSIGRQAKVLYSNGRYWEGTVLTDGKIYKEIQDYLNNRRT